MTDLLGYQNGGSGGQANAVKSMVSNKPPLLNSPGIVLANTLYYDSSSSSVNGCESLSYFGKDKVAFSAVTTVGNPTVNLPNVFFTGTSFIVAQLDGSTVYWPTLETLAGASCGFSMHEGWLASTIDTFTYYLGSSSVSNVDVSMESNLAMALAQCETGEKKSALIQMMGEAMCATLQSTSTTVQTPSNIPLNQSIGIAHPGEPVFARRVNSLNQYGGVTPALTYDASLLQAIIPVVALPFVSMACLDARLHFDTRLLTQSINVRLKMKGINYRAYGPAQFLKDIDGAFKSFSELTFQSSQFELSNKALSIRDELLAAPDFSTGLPFQYPQSMSFSCVVDSTKTNYSSGAIKFNTNITSMMNADLTTIFIAVRDDNDNFEGRAGSGYPLYDKASDGLNSSFAQPRMNTIRFCELEDLELKLNGQLLFRFDKNDYKKVSLQQYLGHVNAFSSDTYFGCQIDSGTSLIDSSSAMQAVVESEICIYEINLSRLRAIVHESHMQNTPRFTNQTMNISGSIMPKYSNTAALAVLANVSGATSGYAGSATSMRALPNLVPCVGATAPSRTFTCHCTYLYNGTFLVGQDGGNSALITA